MAEVRVLSEQFELSVRPADRFGRFWEASGDIIDRERRRPVGRVYGRGLTGFDAEQEVAREADRWILRGLGTR